MNAFDRLVNAGDNSVGAYTFIDADTVRDADGNSYRLEGYDAPEIAGWKGGEFKGGTAGGADATRAITSLMSEQGFNNIVKTGKSDNNGRQIVRFEDADGRDFSQELLKAGVLDPGKYTSQQDVDAIEVARLFRKESDKSSPFGQAAEVVQAAIDAESFGDLKFKEAAISELLYDERYNTSAIQFRKNDRDIHNNSRNPLSQSWQIGMNSAKESYFGALELLGETSGLDWAEDIGEAGIARARSQANEFATVLTDYKDVKSFSTALQFLGNNAAISLPYMGVTAGATAAGVLAAPVIGGVAATTAAIAAPAALYTGQVWNEQEGDNKNAAAAIGSGILQATFDRLGLKGISGAVPDKLWTEGAKALVKTGKAKTVKEANELLANASRKELAGFLKDAGSATAKQLGARKAVSETAKAAGRGAASEAITEGLQEGIGYVGAHTSDLAKGEVDVEELKERILAGVIAGGSLGGAFTLPGSAAQQLSDLDSVVSKADADIGRLSDHGKWAEDEVRQHGRVATTHEIAAEARLLSSGQDVSLEERVDAHKKRKAERTIGEQVFDIAVSTPNLFRTAGQSIFTSEVLQQSRSARKLQSIIGGTLQRTFSGPAIENAKHHAVSIYKGMVPLPEKLYASFNEGKPATTEQRIAISKRVNAKVKQALDKKGRFNPALIKDTDPEKAQIVQFEQQRQKLADTMFQQQKKFNPKLGYEKNYLLNYKSFDKKSIHDNRSKFVGMLKDELQLDENVAQQVADSITGNAEINDVASALDKIQAAGKPGSHRQKTLRLAEKAAFQEFMQQDMYANISDAAKAAARYTTHQEFIGDNNAVINNLLSRAQQEGVDPATVNRMASQLKDLLEAESGNYKRPTTAAGKKYAAVQKNFMFFTTIAALPLSMFSSIVELALTMKGLTPQEIFGKDKQSIKSIATEAGGFMTEAMTSFSGKETKRSLNTDPTEGQKVLEDLGYYSWDTGAATTTGVTEIHQWRQNFLEGYFKFNRLQQLTNYTRAIRASIASDFIGDRLALIEKAAGNKTNESQQAEEVLRNMGINVQDLIKHKAMYDADPNSKKIVDDIMREGTYNFINEAVALPQAANRPLIYQDPRFALFTQFQGFVSTFTANHIPRMWGEYIKRGTPAMKYSTFGVMASMIALGFMSSAMKDWVKDVGADEETKDKYQLRPEQYVRRGINASGLLGSGERVLEQFFPLYGAGHDRGGGSTAGGIADWIFNETTDESPALGYGKRAFASVGKLAQGDVGGAASEAARLTPFGVSHTVRHDLFNFAGGWNFKGE